MALNGLFCADVPLRNYSLTHSVRFLQGATERKVALVLLIFDTGTTAIPIKYKYKEYLFVTAKKR